MNPQMMLAMLFSNSMVTIGMAVLSKSEKTAMQAVALWDMVVDEVVSKVVMEHAEAMAVVVEPTEAVEASVVALATLVEAMEEEVVVATVALVVALVVVAAAAGLVVMSRNKPHPTLSPISRPQEGREAQLFMLEM